MQSIEELWMDINYSIYSVSWSEYGEDLSHAVIDDSSVKLWMNSSHAI